jgi:acyl-ACP thioesterase
VSPRSVPPEKEAEQDFAAEPAAGRIFTTLRSVRSTDATPDGRLRLDALARYLQEAAEDDVLDSGWNEPADWLLRRSVLAIRGYPARGDQVQLRTFCSALGPRWAERTTTLRVANADLILCTAVWVAVDRATSATAPLGPGFRRVYGESAQGRRVSARLYHQDPGPEASGRPWPLRASDFDSAGHVNNTVHWIAVEDALAGEDWLPRRAEIEYQRAAMPDHEPRLVVSRSPGRLDVWLTADGDVLGSARLRAASPA